MQIEFFIVTSDLHVKVTDFEFRFCLTVYVTDSKRSRCPIVICI